MSNGFLTKLGSMQVDGNQPHRPEEEWQNMNIKNLRYSQSSV